MHTTLRASILLFCASFAYAAGAFAGSTLFFGDADSCARSARYSDAAESANPFDYLECNQAKCPANDCVKRLVVWGTQEFAICWCASMPLPGEPDDYSCGARVQVASQPVAECNSDASCYSSWVCQPHHQNGSWVSCLCK
jgi:hypothetical protein